MQSNYVTKDHFDEVIKEKFDAVWDKLKKLDKVSEQMDWLIGKYRDHEEEHTLVNNKLAEHSDNLELINTKLGIQI